MREAPTGVVSAKVMIPHLQSLARERVDTLLNRIWGYRVGLVVAPAGSGKSTLLAGFASAQKVPVAWYRAESWDAKTTTMLNHLESAFAAALGPLPGNWDSVETAARGLESWPGRRALLVIDDLHALEDSPAERTLERLIDYAPPSITFLIGSRALPQFNLSRLRVSGALLEIGSEDLRFRSWEVERLFRDFYRSPLPPEELAELARRTEGWAAGLQLFHLATQGKSAVERRRILSGLGSRSKLTREYLTRNVLDQLAPELRVFLVRTCVLARLSGWGMSCDAHHATAPHPQGAGAVQAMQSALHRASLRTNNIEYVNAHGTATRDNDVAEGNALKTVFGARLPPISSTKRFFGHSLAASGAIEAVVCIEALRRQELPPNIGFETIDPAIGIVPVTQVEPARLTHVMSNSFGFGGNNAVLIFSQPRAKPAALLRRGLPPPLAACATGALAGRCAPARRATVVGTPRPGAVLGRHVGLSPWSAWWETPRLS